METTDKSLLRCTIKKSADVVKKLAKYAAYAIAVVIAGILSIYGAMGVWVVAADPVYKTITAIVSFLSGIPWYYYAGLMAVAAIPVYSFLWCVARELIEEDWKSDEAGTFAFALALAFSLALATFALALAALTLALATFALALAALTLALAADSKVFLFVGAYLHYRKRVKSQ